MHKLEVLHDDGCRWERTFQGEDAYRLVELLFEEMEGQRTVLELAWLHMVGTEWLDLVHLRRDGNGYWRKVRDTTD